MPKVSQKAAVRNAYGLLCVTGMLWASNAVAAKLALVEVPPVAMSFWRWFTVFAVLAPFTLRELFAARRLIAVNWKILIALALLGVPAVNLGGYLGLRTTTAINANLLYGAVPISIVVASWLMTHERITRRGGLGMAFAFVGLVIIVVGGDAGALSALEVAPGDAIILASIVSWAVFSVLLRRRPASLRLPAFLTLVMAVGMVAIAPFYAWEIAAGHTFSATPTNLALILYAGAGVSVMANIMWFWSVGVIGATAAGQFYYLLPLFGSLLAVLVLGEVFEAYHLVGMAMILGGVYLAAAARGPTAKDRAAGAAASGGAD